MPSSPSTPSATTQTVTNSPPPYLQQAQQNTINQAQNLGNTQFQPYGGQPVANLSPMQNQYFQGVENNQGSWQPTTQASEGVMGNVASGQYTPTVSPTSANLTNLAPSSISNGMSKYYDPAISSEIGGMSQAVQRQADIGKAGADRAAGIQGAYGGSGSAIQDAEIQGQANSAIGQYTSQLLPQAFNTAGQLAGQDVSNTLNAGNMTNQANLSSNAQNLGFQQLGEQANLGAGSLALQGAQGLQGAGAQASQLGYQDASQLGTAGQAQQNQAQAELNFPLQQYQQAMQYPFQVLGAEDSAMGTVAPYAGTTTATAQPFSPLAGGMGTGMAAMTLANSFGASRGGRVPHRAMGGPVAPPMFQRHFDGDDGTFTGDVSPPPYDVGQSGNTIIQRDPLTGRMIELPLPPPSKPPVPPMPVANNVATPQARRSGDLTPDQQVEILNSRLDTLMAKAQPNQFDKSMQIAAGMMSQGKPTGVGGVGKGLLAGYQSANQGDYLTGRGVEGRAQGMRAVEPMAALAPSQLFGSDTIDVIKALAAQRGAAGTQASGTGTGQN